MNMKTLPTAELRSLLTAVSDHGQRHLDEVAADLQQTNGLQNDAVENLGLNFMTVHKLVCDQQNFIERLMTVHQFDSEDAEQLEALKQKIGDEMCAVVTGLQFQDLTSQLLAKTINHVNGLKDLLKELGNQSDEINPEHEHEMIVRFLEGMSHSLHTGSSALSGGLKHSVGQQDMASGDIDLF